MKEENEDEEEEGPQERALAWDPWPALIFRKNRLHIDLGFGRHWLQLQPPPPPPSLLSSPTQLPPKTEQGSALNKQLYKHWWSLSKTARARRDVQ